MQHINFLLLFTTMLFLCTWTVSATMLYAGSRKRLLAREALVGLSLMVITAGFMLKYYASNCRLDFHELPDYISLGGDFACLFSLIFFTHELSGIPVSKLRRNIFLFIAIISFFMLLFMPKIRQLDFAGPLALNLSPPTAIAMLVVFSVLFYGTLGYCFMVGLAAGKSIGDQVLRRMYLITFGTCLVCMPALIFFSISGREHAFMVCLCSMFIALSIENCYYSIFFSNQPSYLKNESLTSMFISRFQISDREQEIILQLLGGHTNKEMAETLFISPRTVENHLSSIYQKTTVNSRVQLINLIRANTGR